MSDCDLLLRQAPSLTFLEDLGRVGRVIDFVLATLDQAQREAALFDIDSDKRHAWHFVPDSFIVPGGKRYGLVLKQIDAQQRLLVQGLLATGLSHKGLRQTATVQALEQILYDLENQNPIRDPELYYVSVFGTPSTSQTWSWRFEGHHVSLNFTLVDGKKIAVTPSFFGANPGKVPRGPLEGLRVLAAEEDLARRLVKSLSDQQSREAIIDSKAPADIITGQDRKADKSVFTPARGIGARSSAVSVGHQTSRFSMDRRAPCVFVVNRPRPPSMYRDHHNRPCRRLHFYCAL